MPVSPEQGSPGWVRFRRRRSGLRHPCGRALNSPWSRSASSVESALTFRSWKSRPSPPSFHEPAESVEQVAVQADVLDRAGSRPAPAGSGVRGGSPAARHGPDTAGSSEEREQELRSKTSTPMLEPPKNSASSSGQPPRTVRHPWGRRFTAREAGAPAGARLGPAYRDQEPVRGGKGPRR